MLRRSHRRWLIAAVSVGTALWVTAQVAAGITIFNRAWPITGFGMFKGGGKAAFRGDIIVHTQSGKTRFLKPADLHLPRLIGTIGQLMVGARDPEVLSPGRTPKPVRGGKERFARMMLSYNRLHPSDPARSGWLRLEVYPLPKGDPRVFSVVRWP